MSVILLLIVEHDIRLNILPNEKDPVMRNSRRIDLKSPEYPNVDTIYAIENSNPMCLKHDYIQLDVIFVYHSFQVINSAR